VAEFREFWTLEESKQFRNQTEYTNCTIKAKHIQNHTNMAVGKSQRIQGHQGIQGIQGIQRIHGCQGIQDIPEIQKI
jgi:hypothetical protein